MTMATEGRTKKRGRGGSKPKKERAETPAAAAPASPPPAASAARVPAPEVHTRLLPCKLTSEEIGERAGRVVELLDDITNLEAQKREAAAGFRSQIDDRKKSLRELSRVLNRKIEDRDVECIERMLFETNTVVVERTDDGSVVERRGMTLRERQSMLPGVDVAPPAKAKAPPAADTQPAPPSEPPPAGGFEPRALPALADADLDEDDDSAIEDPAGLLQDDAGEE